jgi:hypothetical protein
VQWELLTYIMSYLVCSLKYTRDSGFKLHKNMEMFLLPIAGGDEFSSLLLLNSLC